MSGRQGPQQRRRLFELDPGRKEALRELLAKHGFRGMERRLRTASATLHALRVEGFPRRETLDRLAARIDEVLEEDVEASS